MNRGAVQSDPTKEKDRDLMRKENLSRLSNTTETLKRPLTRRLTAHRILLVLSLHLTPSCCVSPVPPWQVVLVVVETVEMEGEGGGAGRQWERPTPTNLLLLRNPVPAASATCRVTPGSPVQSGDRWAGAKTVELLWS